jgi:hypothetical protein
MISDWMFLQVGADWWVAGGIIVIGGVLLILLQVQLRKARAEIAALNAQLAAAQEQSQRDMLALGQRIIEADKTVRRFSERLDAIQNTQPIEPRYGQLEALLTRAAQREAGGVASKAEEELLSLLRSSRNA